MTEDLTTKSGRTEYIPATLNWIKDGPQATPTASTGSGDVWAGARADGAVVIPAETGRAKAGDTVQFTPWRVNP